MVFALGLGGETGEVLEIIKKARRDIMVVDKQHLKEELEMYCGMLLTCAMFMD